ncbi:MAG: PQQ-binding-like beta-propeller repeat protein [Phycisphaerae bacterium]|nr:PQQ-binding-like beta-propeller repeat protein [Phycisphaerae bacterium]
MFLVLPSLLPAQEWTRFRGPEGQGIARDAAADIPTAWGAADYQWKVPLPGGGHSSPVVWGDTVFVTSADRKGGKRYLLAINAADGAEMWRRQFAFSGYYTNSLNSYATGTPSVDADAVYVLWPSEEETLLTAVDHAGRIVWERRLAGVATQHGPGNSTIVEGDIVVFAHEQRSTDKAAGGQWIAVDRRTGRTRWTVDRENSINVSYSTPCMYGSGANRALIFNSFTNGVSAVEAATGRIMWTMASAFPKRVVSSPVIAGDLILGSCGQGGSAQHLIAIRPPAQASAAAAVAYTVTGRSAPYVSTSLAVDGLLFTFGDNGDVSCLDAATGEVLWCQKPAGKFYGSPVWVEGRLYCMNREGQVVVLRAGREYERLAVNDLGEMSHATPAVAGGRMFLRTFSHLMCVSGKAK